MSNTNLENLLPAGAKPVSETEWSNLRHASNVLFKPKTPIDDDTLFAGRIHQVNEVLDAVYEDGGHAIIFGERGVGKTSLSRIIEKRVAPIIGSLRAIPISCSHVDTFYAIWENAFGKLRHKSGGDFGFKTSSNPYSVYNAIDELDRSQRYLFIFDEFDRVEDDETVRLMADCIKHFSNHPSQVTIIIVGVGETLIDLFGSHESIARCCSQIRMPRMSEIEMREILESRYEQINFEIDATVLANVLRLSQGLPGYAHLLGQLMLRAAIDRKSTSIEDDDFESAVGQTLEKADQSAKQAYLTAVKSPRKDNKYKEFLLACALAKTDEMGHFYAGDVRSPYSKIRRRNMEITNFATNLSNLCSEARGPALIKSGEPKRFQYRFANPLVQPLAIMQGVKEGLYNLDDED